MSAQAASCEAAPSALATVDTTDVRPVSSVKVSLIATPKAPEASKERTAGFPPKRENRSLAPWGVGLLAALLTAAVVVAAVHQLKINRSGAIDSAGRDMGNLARVLEEQVAHTFRSADALALTIKRQVEKRGLPDDLKSFLDERSLPGAPFLLSLISDETGRSLRHTHSSEQISIAHRVHFKANVDADPDRLVIGEPIIGRISGKWTVHVARRINKPDGAFGGVAVVAIDQGYFSRVYEEVRLGRAGFVMLVGADGIIRARHGEPLATGDEALNARDLLQRARTNPVGSYLTASNEGGPARMISYRVVPEYPLIVAVGTGMEDALGEYVEHREGYIASVALIICLIWASFGLLGWLIVRQRRASLLLQEANDRAESANRVKSEFLASMTHELRTPLNGIIGFADCLQEELADESQRECARIIYSSGCTLLGMVNSVLDIAKIEAGRMELHVSPESVRLLVDEVVALHRPVAEGKALRLEADFDETLPESFSCDRTKLVRVLNNLLHNAIKFTDRGHVSVAARMDGETLILAVKDTGCGISPAMHQAIFDRFTQSEECGVGLRGGTGLGLALARDLVHLMGGRMEVVSQPGQGAEFRVVMPPAAG